MGVFGCSTDARELEELAPSVSTGWMGNGPKVKEFERVFGEWVGADFAMVNSGSSALHAAVAALDLPQKSEVVVPSFTWVACAHAIVLAGHRPVFADVELDTQNLDPESVAHVRSRRTGAIMVVHYAGLPARMADLMQLGFPIIEDAAHAVDSAIDGRRCGTFADVGIYSFDSVKNLATPDGGGVTSPSPEVMARVRSMRYCGLSGAGFSRAAEGGRWWEAEIDHIFPKVLPNDLSASIGLVQLRKLAAHQARRREIWDRYAEELAGLDWLALPKGGAPHDRHSYFTYFVRVLDGRRDRLAAVLLEEGIYTTLRFAPLHRSPIFGSRAVLPVTDRLAEEGLNLPLHPALSDADQERVIDAVRRF
ncbi:MAG: DegT/DnrJ/EryC1/StrS family aminotransferase [Solirubrobacterales bacterium]